MFGKNTGRVFHSTDYKGNRSSAYPYYLPPKNPEGDEEEAIREGIRANPNAFSGQLTIDSDYISYLQSKTKEYKEADYQIWLASQMDLSDPDKKAYWKRTTPGFFKARDSFIDQQAEFQKRLAKIQVTHPQNDSDFRLMYDIHAGYRQLPANSISNLNKIEPGQPTYNFLPALFQKGPIYPQRPHQYGIFGSGKVTDQSNPVGLSQFMRVGNKFF